MGRSGAPTPAYLISCWEGHHENLVLVTLDLVMLTVGCAPGYSAKKPAYPEETPAFREMGKGYQNPETGGEREGRIWREESGR